MAPLPVIRALAEVVVALPGGTLRVDIHHDVFDPDGLRHDRELAGYLLCAAARAEIDLRVHDCFSDEELWAYLESLDVSVLPYRFGTHSGWLEACHDLGTTVIAPTCGYSASNDHACPIGTTSPASMSGPSPKPCSMPMSTDHTGRLVPGTGCASA